MTKRTMMTSVQNIKKTKSVMAFFLILLGVAFPHVSWANQTMYFIHNDHLGTPQVVTDANQSVVWQADYQPFGKVEVTTNLIEQDARFPGQYIDEATGLHYNYFRDYDPTIGRYIQSDPIGLGGGNNTYGYVSGNPTKYIDPHGLVQWTGRIEYGSVGVVVGGATGRIFLTSECVNGMQWYVVLTFNAAGASGGMPYGFGASRIEVTDPFPVPDLLNVTGDFMMSGFTFAPVIGASATNFQIGNALGTNIGVTVGADLTWIDVFGEVSISEAQEKECTCE